MTKEKISDFELIDQDENKIKLSQFKGKKVLLSFHPLAWTGVCANQMQSLEENYDDFANNNTEVLGVSIDPVPTKKAWANELGLKKVKLVSDFWPHGKVAKQFDIFRENDGISERANILINEEGEVVFKKVYELGELPAIEEVISEVKK
ncbi:MAG: redoxin domain-containing protein [bacterium]